MGDYAILKDRQIVPCDLMTWARWFENPKDRIIATTKVADGTVSTVFLGCDHSFGRRPALWFETMIFGGEHADHMERHATYQEAEAGHVRAVELAGGKVSG